MICWWPVVVVAAIALPAVASLLEPDSRENRLTGRFTSPAALPGHVADVIATAGLAVVVVAVAGAVAGLVARWRRGGPVVRQQVSLLALAACPPAVLLPVAVFDAGVPSWAFSVVLLPMPVAIAIAVLTRGLYDLRRAASRGAVWLVTSAVIVLIYLAVVASAAALAPDHRSWWPPALAAAAAAALVVPVRDRLQRRVNRAVYGRSLEPYEVLTELGARLDGVADARRVVAETAAALAAELELEDVAVRGADGVLVAGSPRSPDEAGTVVGLHAFGRQVGTLSFWAPGRELSLREHRLIGDVSRHLGSALHALALRDEVQRARERLVLAREEERRRLRRDLHDGIGPTLAGLTLKARTAQALLPEGAERAAAQLHEIGEEIRRTVTEVRRAVEGLRPPALDELGLAAACTQGLQRIAAGAALHLTACGGDELPPLPAAVEVAAYRIVFEAVTNVVRHAQASACGVSFTAEPDALILQVTDDGTGLSGDGGGTGMASMSERARELGGDLEISSAAGVTVRARLPLSATRSLS